MLDDICYFHNNIDVSSIFFFFKKKLKMLDILALLCNFCVANIFHVGHISIIMQLLYKSCANNISHLSKGIN